MGQRRSHGQRAGTSDQLAGARRSFHGRYLEAEVSAAGFSSRVVWAAFVRLSIRAGTTTRAASPALVPFAHSIVANGPAPALVMLGAPAGFGNRGAGCLYITSLAHCPTAPGQTEMNNSESASQTTGYLQSRRPGRELGSQQPLDYIYPSAKTNRTLLPKRALHITEVAWPRNDASSFRCELFEEFIIVH